jgi:hypothetical protein
MNRNIILKTFDEVRYFRKRLIFAIELKEKVTFLILSNEPIFDIENFRNYLIENELNHFAKNEIINLIELIDSFLNFKIKYEAVPKSENHFNYEYPKKGKGFGDGNLMYVLKVNDSFLKVNEATFNEQEPLYLRLTSLNYFNISSRLLDIKDLFANFLEQPQQTTTKETESETKNILTNETYFTILENCTIEAFESLKLKELYPKNGTKAIWDISSLTITKGDGLPTDRDNELFRKEYILDNMRVTFLKALDRQYKDFEIKHSIERGFFYKKCYQSILFIISNSPLWNEPDFGFNIDKEPCKLTFIWNMRTDIEARSTETIKTTINEAPQHLKPNKHKKSLSEFIQNVNDKEAFLQELKITFPTEIGKSIKAIIDLLKKEKYLIHNDREFSDVVNAIKMFFNRDIGSIQSIRDAKNTDDKIFREPIELKLNPLINKHKTT